MVRVKVRSNLDQTLLTSVEEVLLVCGEIVSISFGNLSEFNNFVQIGVISAVNDEELESKVIPFVGNCCV